MRYNINNNSISKYTDNDSDDDYNDNDDDDDDMIIPIVQTKSAISLADRLVNDNVDADAPILLPMM